MAGNRVLRKPKDKLVNIFQDVPFDRTICGNCRKYRSSRKTDRIPRLINNLDSIDLKVLKVYDNIQCHTFAGTLDVFGELEIEIFGKFGQVRGTVGNRVWYVVQWCCLLYIEKYKQP